MAKNSKEEYRRPAGVNDVNFDVVNINLAKTPKVKEEIKSEKGPKINKEELIISTHLAGATIPAHDGGLPEIANKKVSRKTKGHEH